VTLLDTAILAIATALAVAGIGGLILDEVRAARAGRDEVSAASAFTDGFALAMTVGAGLLAAGAVAVWRRLPPTMPLHLRKGTS
jgi:hypothetical protein